MKEKKRVKWSLGRRTVEADRRLNNDRKGPNEEEYKL